jgi:hypothetical protein
MNRRERLRAYWEQRIPPSESFYLVDAARAINRDRERPIVSLRTLQRRAAEGRLPVLGGYDRAVREYKVLREDLIVFLVDLDVIVGSEPPPPRSPAERRSEPAPARAPAPARPPARPGPSRRPSTHQGNLFDD